jgi:hypothetical protein
LPWHNRMISNVIAPLKYNAMVYEASFTEWDSQPGIRWEGRSTPKEDVRKTVAIARNHLLEPIPMVQSLGPPRLAVPQWQEHGHRGGPEGAVRLRPGQPAHLRGHLRPVRGGHRAVPAEDLPHWARRGGAERHVPAAGPDQDHHGLRDRGHEPPIRLAEGEGPGRDDVGRHAAAPVGGLWRRGLRAHAWRRPRGGAPGIPKDILIADWHYNYSAEPEYPSVEVLQKDGFRVLGSTWFGWGNIQGFAKELAKQDSLGLLQTTWAGFSMSMDLMETQELGQFIAYVVAAEAAWNGGRDDPRTMDYSAEDAFLTLWNRKPIATETRPGFTVDLDRAGNTGMWSWMPGADGTDRAGFPEGAVTLVGTAFNLTRPVLLAGPLNPAGAWPRELSLTLGGRKASDLHFLWGATHPAAMLTPVAHLTVTYADGTKAEVPIAYGRELFAFSDLRARKHTTVAWRGKTPDGQRADARRWIWTNPPRHS